jgi:hypothetical protein
MVGDLFTKGPDPAGVARLLVASQARSVLGNHDDRLLVWLGDERPDSEVARTWAALRQEAAPSPGGWAAWLRALPTSLEVEGWTVVHAGLAPDGLAATSRARRLNLRRYPRELPECPFWYEVYRGPERVVFGHDARRGLVRRDRDGQPWIRGLDTGCVYGGALTGWILEEDRVVQVPARRVWRPVSG